MSEMVERGAVAMAAKRRELINQPLARIWPDLMRAAIEAMREPTGAMFRTGQGGDVGLDSGAVWCAMIDEALK